MIALTGIAAVAIMYVISFHDPLRGLAGRDA